MRAVEPFGRRVAYAVRRIPDEISPYGRSECPSGVKSYAMSFSGHYLGTRSRDMSIISDVYSGRPCDIRTGVCVTLRPGG
jgi:hypothetical protein